MKVQRMYTEEEVQIIRKLEFNQGFQKGFDSGEKSKTKSVLEFLESKKAN
jgi:hypothetical protein